MFLYLFFYLLTNTTSTIILLVGVLLPHFCLARIAPLAYFLSCTSAIVFLPVQDHRTLLERLGRGRRQASGLRTTKFSQATQRSVLYVAGVDETLPRVARLVRFVFDDRGTSQSLLAQLMSVADAKGLCEQTARGP